MPRKPDMSLPPPEILAARDPLRMYRQELDAGMRRHKLSVGDIAGITNQSVFAVVSWLRPEKQSASRIMSRAASQLLRQDFEKRDKKLKKAAA